MKVKSVIKGPDKILKAFEKFEAQAKSSQVLALKESTLLVHSAAVKLLQDNTDGTIAIRHNPKRAVFVSKPGDPPNTDTGRAVKSIKFDFKNGGLTGRVGTNLKYLADLEFGTKKMAPRPWLSRAVTEVAGQVAEIFAKHLKGAVKESKK